MSKSKPVTIVIFGASGDLTKRKLIPALFQNAKENLLPEKTRIIGFARSEKSHETFRSEMQDALAEFSRSKPQTESKEVADFLGKLYYHCGSYDDESSFKKLKAMIEELDKEDDVAPEKGNRLYYLSIPPKMFSKVIAMLGQTDHIVPADAPNWTRVIIEKPFGHDLESARALNHDILSVLDESQVYRIDHYLGKETVQNIMAFRFGNSIFEPLWNRRYVDNVQITVAEAVGVGSRAGYYDQSGALRDMVQNHILQLLSLVAMEPPASFEPNAVRNEKVKVLSSLRPLTPKQVAENTVRGQYTAGETNGKQVPDYLNEPDVTSNSKTETFVALKAQLDNWRWAGVPFYVRTGKALSQRITEINIKFRQPPLALFKHTPHEGHVEGDEMEPNTLSLRVQPNEGIRLHFGLKTPGPDMVLRPTEMEFCYSDIFDAPSPEAYERLLLDAALGDTTLFIRNDEVEAAWTFVDPILQAWADSDAIKIHPYSAGSWGPAAADDLLARDNREWEKLSGQECSDE